MPFGDPDDTTEGTPGDIGSDAEHGGVTDDALEAAAGAQFGDLSSVPASGAADAGGETDDGDGGDSTPPPSSSSESFDLGDGLTISRDQAKALAEFDRFLADDPQLAELISGTIMGTHKVVPVAQDDTQTPPPPASPLAPPDDLDLDDPAIKLLWENLQAERSAREQQAEQIQRHEAQLQSTTAATVTSAITRAKTSYQTQHNLSDKDMTEIEEVAGRLNVVPSLMSPVDPTTGLPRKVDPLRALESAFELAHWQIPRLREAQIAAFQSTATADTKRKKKLSSLGGSSGNSTTRQPQAVPTNPAERRQAMISEMATMLQGNWVNPDDA